MDETKIIEALNTLTRQVIVLKDCYTSLHNTIIHRSTNVDEIITERTRAWLKEVEEQFKALRYSIRETKRMMTADEVKDVKEMIRDMLEQVDKKNQDAFKWVGKHIYQMQEALCEISRKDTKKIKVKFEWDGGEKELEEAPYSIKDLLQSLPKRSKEIVEGIFGEDGNQSNTQASVGRKYKITGNRVSQLLNRALRKIRQLEIQGVISKGKIPECRLKDEIFGIG